MRNRVMKSILVGTLAVVVSAIVVGPAFGGSFIPNQQGSPPQQVHQPAVTSGADAIPLDVLHTMGTQWYIPASTQGQATKASASGYSAFPEVVRTMNDGKLASSSDSGFNWSNGGLSLGVGIASVLALVSVGLIRRHRSTAVPA